MTRLRCWALASTLVFVMSCSSPAKPSGPADPGPAPTAPVIRSITVPTSYVEAGQDIAISAVVEDAETPIVQLGYQWAASAGSIIGNGANATWRIPLGLKAGVDVTVTLTVSENYQALQNGVIVTKQNVVSSTSPSFRVHDTDAETKELARKFLVDLFGNSSVPAEACMVDFAAICAALPEGKNQEYLEVVSHRQQVIVYKATMLHQRLDRFSPNTGSVHTAMLYEDQLIGKPPKPPTCGDFEVTVVYDQGRWWICESYFNRGDLSYCPANVSNAAVAGIMRARGGTSIRNR